MQCKYEVWTFVHVLVCEETVVNASASFVTFGSFWWLCIFSLASVCVSYQSISFDLFFFWTMPQMYSIPSCGVCFCIWTYYLLLSFNKKEKKILNINFGNLHLQIFFLWPIKWIQLLTISWGWPLSFRFGECEILIQD